MPNQTKPIILVDGSSYLYRAFHAMPPLTNSKGNPTGAAYGIINMLKRLMADYSPEHMAVIFDARGKTFRDELYPAYKATRESMPPELSSQVQPIHDLIRAMGIPLLVVDGVEADDVIGTLAEQASKTETPVLISTGDKDFAQLVNHHITLINTMSNAVMTPDTVKVKFGVAPSQIIDYLTLVGDTSDNVPGVPQVGPKTAAKWLLEHGSLDAIVKNADSIKGKVGEKFREFIPQLPLTKTLVTIKLDVELPFGLHDLEIKETRVDDLQSLYQELEFKSWLAELIKNTANKKAGIDPLDEQPDDDVRNAQDEQNAGSPRFARDENDANLGINDAALNINDLAHIDNNVARNSSNTISSPHSTRGNSHRQYETVNTKEQLAKWIKQLETADIFAFDTETTSIDYMQAKLVGLCFAIVPGTACYIPVGHDYEDAPHQLDLDYVLAQVKPVLENAAIKKICQHIKYDMEVMKNYNIHIQGHLFDTMLESYVLNSTANSHGMDTLALKYLGINTIKYVDIAGKGAKQLSFNDIPVDVASTYASEDADITLQLHNILWSKLQNVNELKSVFENIEMPLVPVLVHMERNGVLIDPEKLRIQEKEIQLRLKELELDAFKMAGVEFNLNSPKQLQDILFDKLKHPVLQKTPTGQASTADAVLQELALDFPLPGIIIEYRSLSKLMSTYTSKLVTQINPDTGRIHTSYNQTVTATGRLSSSEPNLQNIPIRMPEGRRIRQAFIAPPGCKIMSADYSQIELRLMAHMSEDPALLSAFSKNLDIHIATAAEVAGIAIEKVTADMRRNAKAVNFGLIYGMSAFGLTRQLGITRKAAQDYIDQYFLRYPNVKAYMDNTRVQAKEKGYVETLWGRRLYLPEINAKQVARQKAAERTAINAPLQGTAADIIKLAMIRIEKWLKTTPLRVKMIMQVHDELVFEVADDDIEAAKTAITEHMSQVASLKVPLVVSVGVGNNWDDAH